jgi:hypothetical protein
MRPIRDAHVDGRFFSVTPPRGSVTSSISRSLGRFARPGLAITAFQHAGNRAPAADDSPGGVRPLAFYVLYAVISSVFCSPLFARPAALGGSHWDQHLFYYAEVLKNVVEYAQPPFWSPWHCGGNVLWQNPEVALLSPVYALAMVMPLALAMKVNIVLHYWIGFVGMHKLLTRVFGLTFVPGIIYLASVVTLAGGSALHLAVGHSVFLPAFYLPVLMFFVCRAFQSDMLRPALYAAALLALTIYNGGAQLIPIIAVGIGMMSVCVAVARRRWQPLVLAAVVAGFGLTYAAPRLAPVAHFVSSDRFRDTRNPIDHPDRMTLAMVARAYADPSQNVRSAFSSAQRHGWWEYGNYIGSLASILIVASLVWSFAAPSTPERLLPRSMAATTVVLFVLSLGEFSAFAPAQWLRHVPAWSALRIPSRYTIGFVLFGTLVVAAVAGDMAARLARTRARRFGIGIICASAVFQLVAVNRAHFRDAFTLPPLDSGFRILKGTGTLVRDPSLSASSPNSPMLRALMRDQAVFHCHESLQLTRGADLERPLVWSDGRSIISSIVFTPNRVQFSAVGGFESSRVYLNQNYAPGWRSTAGPVLLDSQDGGRPYVELARGQTDKFAFSFVPPGLIPGTVLLLVALVASRLLWRRRLPAVTVERAIDNPRRTAGLLFSARAERASRLLMLASLLCAIATRIMMAGEAQTKLAVLALVSFSAAAGLCFISRTTVTVLLTCTYVAPLLVSRLWVHDATAYLVFLMAGLIGVMLPRWSSRRWALPASWRLPLVAWGLAAAVTWPIVAAREVDFHPDLVALLIKPVSLLGLPAWIAVVLVADAAAMLMLCVLWLDWLFATFAGDECRFTRTIIVPLLTSSTAACAVATYQLVRDMSFMNEGWRVFRRAGGTMLDANALGTIAMLSSCACVAWADWRSLRSKIMAVVILALASTAVWASGSRTALIAELVALAWAVWSTIYGGETTHSAAGSDARRRTQIACVLVASVLIGAGLYVAKDTGPALRLGWIVPSPSADSVGAFFKETLWNRAGYGTAAVEMIRKNPWFGVGVGTFPVRVGDYPSHLRRPLVPDNAQNWVRHWLAEVGLVGSLAWITWAVVIAVWVARRCVFPAGRRSAIIMFGALAGIVVVSQVGMPTQNPAVALTCWTFLFWYVLACSPGDTTTVTRIAVAPWWGWGLTAGYVMVVTIGTWIAGTTTLQVPMRARDTGWPYDYGFSRPELTPSGETFRWAQQYGVAVVPAPTRVVKLTVWTTRADVAANPVQARVWHENRVVIDTVLRDQRPVTTYVVVDRDPRWLMVRTYFDRVVPPNARELGLAVQWTFIEPDSRDALSSGLPR